MLKVNVGLSRKLSHDYNSTGFSVNLEGEVLAPLDDPALVLTRIRELYDLAEESLNQQIESHKTGQRVEAPPLASPSPPTSSATLESSSHVSTRAENTPSEEGFIPATNKQITFLLNLGKRQGLNKPQLENRVAEYIGREVDLYGLSKREAGVVLDRLTQSSEKTPANGRR